MQRRTLFRKKLHLSPQNAPLYKNKPLIRFWKGISSAMTNKGFLWASSFQRGGSHGFQKFQIDQL